MYTGRHRFLKGSKGLASGAGASGGYNVGIVVLNDATARVARGSQETEQARHRA